MRNGSGLHHIIYGISSITSTFEILASSLDVPRDLVAFWHQSAALDPLPQPDPAQSQTYGLFRLPERLPDVVPVTNAETEATVIGGGEYLLVRAQQQDDHPLYEFVPLLRSDLNSLSGSARLLIDHLFDAPLPALTAPHTLLEPYPIPIIPTWTFDRRISALNRVIAAHGGGDLHPLLALLGAALSPQGVLIRGFNAVPEERLDLVQSLLLLLPSFVRPDLTFSTGLRQPEGVSAGAVRLIFSEVEDTGRRWVADFPGSAGRLDLPLDELRSPYVDCLLSLWDASGGDTRNLVAELRAMELLPTGGHMTLATSLNGTGPLMETLTLTAVRYLEEKHRTTVTTMPVERLKTLLAEESPLLDDLEAGAQRLLDHTLDTRDADAALLVTRLMDQYPELDAPLNTRLEEALKSHPDAVYFVIRTHLAQGIDERWLPRLHAAAVHSLRIAIEDSDTETLGNWLRLIVREPAAYQLGAVLRQGIQAAQQRAHDDGAFGVQLLLLAARRTPDSFDMLLEDPALLAALPPDVAAAVRDEVPEAIAGLLNHGRALFLAILARGLNHMTGDEVTPAVHLFTPEMVRLLHARYLEEPTAGVPERYQPVTLLKALLTDGVRWLAPDALAMLVALLLANPDTLPEAENGSLMELIGRVAARDPALLVNALQIGQLAPDAILTLTGAAVSAGTLTAPQSVQILLQLLEVFGWNRLASPLAEQIARVLQNQAALTLTPERTARMLQFAADTRSELILRVLAKRSTADLEKIEGERALVEQMYRLWEQTGWHSPTRQMLVTWWREFVRQQPLARLQALEKALEKTPDGKKPLEEVRVIVHTVLALRRVFGKRTMEEFADLIALTYTILQAMSDSFDPEPRHNITLDQTTLRSEMDARLDTLTPDESRVLAKNLRELGSLIAEMSEHRSRASLMRREDEVERQLMTGEQQPQSAIDMMKWFSGYLEGAQDNEDGEGN